MANLSWDEVGTSVHDYGNTPVGAPTPDQTLVPPDEWSGIGTPVTEYGQEAPKPEISTTEDVLKSTGSGLARGIYNANQMVNSIPGPGDALNWAGRKISHAAGWTE